MRSVTWLVRGNSWESLTNNRNLWIWLKVSLFDSNSRQVFHFSLIIFELVLEPWRLHVPTARYFLPRGHVHRCEALDNGNPSKCIKMETAGSVLEISVDLPCLRANEEANINTSVFSLLSSLLRSLHLTEITFKYLVYEGLEPNLMHPGTGLVFGKLLKCSRFHCCGVHRSSFKMPLHDHKINFRGRWIQIPKWKEFGSEV